jgi:hypothetical protein
MGKRVFQEKVLPFFGGAAKSFGGGHLCDSVQNGETCFLGKGFAVFGGFCKMYAILVLDVNPFMTEKIKN